MLFRSVFFDHDKGKTHSSGKLLFNCRVIPNRGSWLDFEYDIKDLLYFRIDRKRKLLVSTLLQALNYNKKEIADLFYESEEFEYNSKLSKWKTIFNPENYKFKKISEEIIDAKTNKVVVKFGSRTNFLQAKKLYDNGLKDIYVSNDAIYGRFLHNNISLDSEVNISAGTEITEEILDKIRENNIETIQISNTNTINKGPYLLKTILLDKNNNKKKQLPIFIKF